MASLTGTKIKDTYDALLKVSDNGALDGTLQTITDGLGNNSALSLSTAGASVGGTLSVSGATTLSSTLGVSGLATFSSPLKLNDSTLSGAGGFEMTSESFFGARFQSNAYKFMSGNNSTEYARIHSGGDISFRDSSANEAFYWDASAASLGIGKTNPIFPIDIYNTSAGNARINIEGTTNFVASQYTNSSGAFYIGIDDSAGANFTGVANARFLYSAGAYPMIFSTNATERMRIDSSGNVGIGGTPTEKLDVIGGALAAGNGTIRTGITYSSLGLIGTFTNHDLGIITNGSERMRIDSSGNVGINCSPDGKLKVVGSSGAQIIVDLNGTNQNYFDADTTIFRSYGGGGYPERMRIKSTGDIKIQSGSLLGWSDFSSGVSGVGVTATTAGSENLLFYSTGTERMRITSVGDVFIGDSSTTNTGKIEFSTGVGAYSGGIAIRHSTTNVDGSGYINFYRNTDVIGSINQVGTTSVAYNTSSDYRLKEDWIPMEGALDRVDALKPINFAWKSDGRRVDGFLAHELAEVIPEAVTGEKDATRIASVEVSPAVYEDVIHPAEEAILDEEGNVIQEAKEEWVEKVLVSEAVFEDQEVPLYQGIDQSKIVPLLVAGLQEAHELIKSLQAKIETLENKELWLSLTNG